MTQPVLTASITLNYPLYASDFDPNNNNNYLLVGGGGGESRSGVGNQITLLHAGRKQISEVVDIELSRDEDSVTSLAVVSSSEKSIVAFAGINSSEAEQKARRNQHLRSFKLHHPAKRDDDDDDGTEALDQDTTRDSLPRGKTEALARTSLFTPSTAVKPETYQRVLRLMRTSKSSSSSALLGAIATGLAPQGEVVVFKASSPRPEASDVVQRINLGDGKEAADIDLINARDGEDRLAYCTDYDVYMTRFDSAVASQQSSPEPEFLHGTPHPDAFASTKTRPKFRALRFLTPSLILLLQNKADRKGAELLLLEVPKRASLGMIILRKRLPKSIPVATALSTALLPASSSSASVQHAIAVAGQDNSITILTLNHPASSPPYGSLAFSHHATLHSVHPLQITSLTFSTFTSGHDTKSSPPPPLPLKLASTSIAKTVVIHTLPLILAPSSTKNPTSKNYILRPLPRSEAAQITFSLIVSALVIALGAFFLQAFTEIRGGTPEYLGAKGWLSERVHNYIARPYMFDDNNNNKIAITIPHETIPTTSIIPSTTPTPLPLRLRHLLSPSPSNKNRIILINPHPDGISSALHIDVREGDADADADADAGGAAGGGTQPEREPQKWENLPPSLRTEWKRRLIEAGEWAVEEGEEVLKGVFFGTLGGVVGEVVAGG